MFKSSLTALAVVAATLVASPASADQRLITPEVCVTTDFTVTGSGWKVQRMVGIWDSVQSVVHLTMGDSSCRGVVIHRYRSATDGACGWTRWDRPGISLVMVEGGVEFSGADIYLNDWCKRFGRDEMKAVIAHELGHAMGLPHNESTRSIMGPNNSDRWHGVPQPVDVRNLAALYR